ncbi:MAG: spermidine synthase [Sphingomicrobium sp.]
MKVRELLATAQIPGGEELRLFRRDRDYMIVLDRNELMNSRMSGSEEQLAALTIARLRNGTNPRLLIGGYGMGFTLRAALAVLPAGASVVVAELVPDIIAWARGPMAELTAGCLDDSRVSVVEGDVAAVIAAARGTYDAILLDVDNGPDGLTRTGNDGLYSASGLAAAKAALVRDGIFAIWSASDDPAFTRRLNANGFAATPTKVRARPNGKGPQHTIWLAESI